MYKPKIDEFINEKEILSYIGITTKRKNYDNISRTLAYQKYYFQHREIKWAYLASMVSRNAGWSMTDLQGKWFRKSLTEEQRHLLFLTYERANWMIFQDAFPQLLIYSFSKKFNRPLFHLLPHLQVSRFMEEEWLSFWKEPDLDRLMKALIINEQNVIQKPILEKEPYKSHVFKSIPYKFQDLFHFSTVLFPTLEGSLFGFSVYDFSEITNRIDLGKKLAWLLFESGLYEKFVVFSQSVSHTGSRYDYEFLFPDKRKRETPLLRTTYPIISHSLDEGKEDWFHGQNTKKWFKEIKIPKKYELTFWFKHKQDQLHMLTLLQEYWKQRK
ncbi:DUF2515 family protein [Bacillus weihaiensis]|uniref:DUF2515 family protein n=1 Tax=Bacillus weihaiensis TaxID=1547283 RepID=UPI0009F946C8|nr:DUF2515 family protein [Bacillus weihaiensis]